MKRKFLANTLVLGMIVASVSGCEWMGSLVSIDKAKSWYEKQPDNFEDYMAFAAKARSAGDLPKASQYYKDGRDFAEVLYGKDDGRVATSSNFLAGTEEQLGHVADAEADYRKALEIDKKLLGWNHPETIEIRRALARVLLVRFKEDEAKALLVGLKPVRPARVNPHKGH